MTKEDILRNNKKVINQKLMLHFRLMTSPIWHDIYNRAKKEQPDFAMDLIIFLKIILNIAFATIIVVALGFAGTYAILTFLLKTGFSQLRQSKLQLKRRARP